MASIDLHFHSHASDGALPPEQVIARAAEREATLVALTDHDCTHGLAAARAEAARRGLAFLNGVEVSVSWGKHTVHIVGLGIDPNSLTLAAGLQSIRDGRVNARGRCRTNWSRPAFKARSTARWPCATTRK